MSGRIFWGDMTVKPGILKRKEVFLTNKHYPGQIYVGKKLIELRQKNFIVCCYIFKFFVRRFMKCKKFLCLTFILVLSLMCASYTSAGIVYVDATEGEGGNTMLAMGEVFYVHGRWQRQ